MPWPRRNQFYKTYDIKYVKHWIEQAPEFELKPITVDSADARKFRAVVNKQTNKVVAIVSDKFQLVQHKTVFNLFLDTLEDMGYSDVKGMVRWTDTRAYLYTYFHESDLGMKDKHQFGLVITNGVDGSLAIWSRIISVRIACMNLFSGTELYKIIKTVHVGIDIETFIDRIQTRFIKVIKAVMDYPDYLTQQYQQLKQIEIEYPKAIEFVTKKLDFLPKKALAVIRWQLRRDDKVTLYDLLQAVTYYLSNYSEVSDPGKRLVQTVKVEKAIQDLMVQQSL